MPKDEKLLEHRDESFYEWGPALNGLKQKLYNDEGNTFLVSAPFGWGKSSFTNILKKELENEEKEKKIKWDINIIHTWKYELLDSSSVVSQLIFDLVNEFLSKIELIKIKTEKGVQVKRETAISEYDIINKEVLKKYGIKFLDVFLEKKLGITTEDIKKIHKTELAQKIEEIGEELKNNYIDVLKFYEKFLLEFMPEYNRSKENKTSQIVFIFRDCDRCNPENLLKIVDAIHHIDADNKIKFVVESDIDSIKSIICAKYNLGDYFVMESTQSAEEKNRIINGYLDKIFDSIIVLERSLLNVDFLAKYLNKLLHVEIHPKYLTIQNFNQIFNRNFRFIKNSLEKHFAPKFLSEELHLKIDSKEINALIIIFLFNELHFSKISEINLPRCNYGRNRLENLEFLNYGMKENRTTPYFIEFDPKISLTKNTPERSLNFYNSICMTLDGKKMKLFNFQIEDFHYLGTYAEECNVINKAIDNTLKYWSQIQLH